VRLAVTTAKNAAVVVDISFVNMKMPYINMIMITVTNIENGSQTRFIVIQKNSATQTTVYHGTMTKKGRIK
jgi:hypothetical protein